MAIFVESGRDGLETTRIGSTLIVVGFGHSVSVVGATGPNGRRCVMKVLCHGMNGV